MTNNLSEQSLVLESAGKRHFQRERIECSECCKPINQEDPLAFSGTLACESCIRAFYEPQYSEAYGYDSLESFLLQEIQSRRYDGRLVLKRILREREKSRIYR